jgi:hypothetical protein
MGEHNVIIFAAFESRVFLDPESVSIGASASLPSLNIGPATISYSISARPLTLEGKTLSITTNGITGLITPLSSFNIPKINFANQNIYFTAKVVDLSGAGTPLKQYPKLLPVEELLKTQTPGPVDELVQVQNTIEDFVIVEEGGVDVRLIRSDNTSVPVNQVLFTSNYGELSADAGGGYVKGIVQTSAVDTDLRIQIVYTDANSNTVSGVSTPFDIYPAEGIYDIRKIGEDNNQAQNYKDLATQPVLQREPIFMDQLLGQIVGDGSTYPETLGIKLSEKVSNYVANINDPDYANVKSLNSLISQLSMTMDEYNQQFPPSLARLIDILSVSVSRQAGSKNQFQGNYDSKGYISKEFYGKNKGDILPLETTLLETGANSKNILAYEKFSNQYKLVNTNILSATDIDYTSDSTYPLSAYNRSWGWGLIVPLGITPIDINKYYEFYDVIDTVEGSYLQKFIDFDNVNNTYLTNLTSYDQYADKWGIAEKVISHNLYTNLGLIAGS